jgi:arsenate reductase
MKILFVCVENAGRSQMAEALAKKIASDKKMAIEIYSAGSRPAVAIHPAVVQVMREIGIDLSALRPKGFDALSPKGPFDWVIGMGCGDACPFQPAKQRLTWDIPDPKGKTLEEVRMIRDEIAKKVHTFLDGLTGDRSY